MTTTNITQTTVDNGLLYNGGFKWADTRITYSVPGYAVSGSIEPVYYVPNSPTGSPKYDDTNTPRDPAFGILSQTLNQVNNFASAMEIWDSYIAPNLDFVQDTTKDGVTGSVGDIRVAFSNVSPAAGRAQTPPPPNTPAAPSNGDIFLNALDKAETFAQGTYGFQVMLHEAGHALGIQHPFVDDNQLASYVTGQNGENYNLHTYSVMSYNSPDSLKTIIAYADGGASSTINPVVDLTPMVLDIQAIQDLYGKDLSTGSGNNTYAYSDASFNGRQSLYDASGTDTLDFSQISRGSHIDLRPGAYSDIDYFSQADQIKAGVALAGEGQRNFVTSEFDRGNVTYQWTNNFAIAFSTVIENVIGTGKADTIIGNTAANVITGGAGADTISGGGGKDIFRDTAANLNGDTITDFNNSDAIHVTNATGALQNLTYSGGTLSFSLPNAPGTTYAMTVNGATGIVQQRTDALGGVDIFFGLGSLPAPSYAIAAGATSVLEGIYGKENSLTYTVTRTSADSAASVDVAFTGTAQSTARYGRDFTTLGLDGGNRLFFAAGALTATFTIKTVGDTNQESNESIITTISNATDGTIALSSVTINITDDDGPGGVSGKVVDGYVVGATVFADTNGNGVLDPGEASGVTDSQGSFALNGAIGPLLSIGGTDSSTGLTVTAVMTAPNGASIITPLTTIVQTLAASGVSDPVGRTLAAFGLPSSFDLTHTNPVEAIESGVPGAVTAIRAGAMVIDTLLLIAAGLEGAGASVGSADASATSAIASYVASHGAVDLTHADVVTAIASSTGLSSLVATTIGNVAAASNTAVAGFTNFEDQGLGAIQLSAQRDAASAIVAAGSDPAKLADIDATYGHQNVDLGSFGTLIYDAASPGGAIFELYEGLLGRAPDPTGDEFWLDAINHGASLRDVAAGILGSSEYSGRNGPPASETNAGFVNELYQVVLGRAGDADGKAFWTDALDHGTLRSEVALDFALSSESKAQDAAVLRAGVFVPDPVASDVARLYYAVLDRAPDAQGLQFWTSAVKVGTSEIAVAQNFVDSAEHAGRFGTSTNAMFIDQVYEGALGRHVDSAGLAFWQGALASGQSRGAVALGIADSPEANAHHLAEIEQGWHIA